MKHLISTIEVRTSLVDVTEMRRIAFKHFGETRDIESGLTEYAFSAFKIIPEVPEVPAEGEEGEENYVEAIPAVPEKHELIGRYPKTMSNAEKKALWAIVGPQITSVEYDDIEDEKVLRGAMEVIDSKKFFGLTKNELMIV